MTTITDEMVLREFEEIAKEPLVLKSVEGFPFPIAHRVLKPQAYIVVGSVEWEEVREKMRIRACGS